MSNNIKTSAWYEKPDAGRKDLVELNVYVLLSSEQIRNNDRIRIEIDLSATKGLCSSFSIRAVAEHFTRYADIYKKKDRRMARACSVWFSRFCAECYSGTETLTAITCSEFRDYLYDNLNGNTPGNYFKKFREFLEEEVRMQHLASNPARGIRLSYTDYRDKAVLTREDIAQLHLSPCKNIVVKQAFLLSCYCGLRWCDIVSLRVMDIDMDEATLCIMQQKVASHSSKARLKTYLNSKAYDIVRHACADKKGEEHVFSLPSYAVMYKTLKEWVKSSGIKKHITFHCARHTFISMLISCGVDIKTVADLAGHSSTRHTERYVHSEEKHLRECIRRLENGETAG